MSAQLERWRCTPGDWVALVFGKNIQSDEHQHEIHAGEHGACVALVPVAAEASTHGEPGATVITEAQALANLHLMAAAPQMQRALWLVENFISWQDALRRAGRQDEAVAIPQEMEKAVREAVKASLRPEFRS